MTHSGRAGDEEHPDSSSRRAGRPGASYGLHTLRAVTVGALLVIAGGLALDAPAVLSADQRLIGAGIAALLAALLGLSRSGYLRRR